MKRDRKDKKERVSVTVQVRPSTKAAIKQLAQEMGCTQADAIDYIMRTVAEAKGLELPE